MPDKKIDLSIVFKTFLRPECLNDLLNSINEYQNKYNIKFYEIIIVDDSDEECVSENKSIINKYPKLNINHKIYPFNSEGTSKGRNKGIAAVKTDYFILCDDDNLFDCECDFEKNLNLIREKKVDVLGGYYKNIKSLKDTNFVKHNWVGFITENEEFDNCVIFDDYYPEFCFCDITENFYIAKTKSIQEIGYPEDMAQLEHNVFFLRLKQKGVKIGFSSQMFIKHFHRTNKNKNYDGHRNREVINPISKKVNGLLISGDTISTFDDYLHVGSGKKYIYQKDEKKKYTVNLNLLLVKMSIYFSFIRALNKATKKIIKIMNMCFAKHKLLNIKKQYPKVMSTTETLNQILKGKSIARLGDGELQLVMGHGLGEAGSPQEYQIFDKNLSNRLSKILKNPIPNCITAIDHFSDKWNDEFNYKNNLSYWENFWLKYWDKLKNVYNNDYSYGCTATTRVSVFKENKLEDIKKIWNNKKVLFVVGNGSHFVFDKRLFNNIKQADMLVVKGKSSFSDYNNILEKIKTYNKDWLIFMALGPTATVLAYDLSKDGYQALDMGHLPNCYLQAIGERERPEAEHFKGKQFKKEEGLYKDILKQLSN